MIESYISNIKKIFSIKLDQINLVVNTYLDDQILIRSDKDYTTKYYDIEQIYDLVCINNIPKPNKSYHEMLESNKNY